MKFGLIAIILILLQGCGGASLTSNLPTLTLAGTNLDSLGEVIPTNIGTIEIQVLEEIDPLFFNSENIHLMPGLTHNTDANANAEPSDVTSGNSSPFGNMDHEINTDAIEGTAWFDPASKKIFFQPSRSLSPGVTYHLRIQDITLANGQKVSQFINKDGSTDNIIEISFTTAHLHETLQIRYDKDGTEVAYTAFDVFNNTKVTRKHFDKNKEITYQIKYDAVLPLPSSRSASSISTNATGEITEYNYDVVEANKTRATVRFKDAGADLIWGTDDDLAVSWREQTTNAFSHIIIKNHVLEDLSNPVMWTSINSPGFKLRSIYLKENATSKLEDRTIFYRDLGANGEIDIDPLTEQITIIDDNVSLWYKRDFIDGNRIRAWSIQGVSTETSAGGEGLDNILFTDDDIASGVTTYVYYPVSNLPSSEKLKLLISYYGTGLQFPANTWFTDLPNNLVRADVPVHSYHRYIYDEFGNRSEDLTYSPGEDGIMASESELDSGLADDYITRRVIYSTLPTISGTSLLGLP